MFEWPGLAWLGLGRIYFIREAGGRHGMGMGTGVGEKSKDANFIFRPLLYSSIQ
jgi:hypothetical protein